MFKNIWKGISSLSKNDWITIVFLFGLSVVSLFSAEQFCKNAQGQSTVWGLILRQLSSVFAISGALAVILRRQMHTELIALVADKVKIARQLLSSGINQVLSQFGEADFQHMTESAQCEIDISIIYGSTWLKTNLHFLEKAAQKPSLRIRFICLDPDSEVVPLLQKKFDDGGEHMNLKNRINDTIQMVRTRFVENNSTKATVELYLQPYISQHCIYRFDTCINVLPYALSPGRKQIPMFTINKVDTNAALYDIFANDLEQLFTNYSKCHLTNSKKT